MEKNGEKIDGTRQRVAQAVVERKRCRIRQGSGPETSRACSTWLDVNAGTRPDKEPEDLVGLIENLRSVVGTPLALGSANPDALKVAVRAVNEIPTLVTEHGCLVISPNSYWARTNTA
jgi:hypothetical protein